MQMSGVIIDGVQWEKCNACLAWVRIQDLWYEVPSVAHRYGRDLCAACGTTSKLPTDSTPTRFVVVLPPM